MYMYNKGEWFLNPRNVYGIKESRVWINDFFWDWEEWCVSGKLDNSAFGAGYY